MSNPLREILASFTVDASGVKKGIGESNGLISGLKGELGKLGGVVAGAFAVGSLVSFGAELIREADATAVLAGTLGMAAAELQGWQWAAKSSNVEATKLTGAIRKLQEVASTPAKAGAFAKYKIDLKEADGSIRSTNDLLSDTARVLAGIEDPSKRAGAAIELFGGAGADLLPLFAKGEEGIADLRAEVERLGFAFDEEFVRGSSQVTANLDRLKAGFRGVVMQGLGPLLPALTELTEIGLGVIKWMVDVSKQFSEWIKDTKFAEAAVTMLALKGLAMLVGGLAKAIVGVGGLRMAFLKLLPLLFKVILPMLLIEDFLVFLAGGQSAFGKMLNGLFGDGSAESFRETLQGIIKDLKEGRVGDGLRKSLEGVLTVFAAMGEFFVKSLINTWNMFVEKNSRLAALLGLEKIDESSIDTKGARTSYERDRERAEQAQSGTEDAAQRAAREALIPGASEISEALRLQGLGVPQAAGEFPALVGEQGKDGSLKLLGEVARNLGEAVNWVEDRSKPAEFVMPGQIPAQNVETHLKIENRINVQMPPGEGDLGARLGDSVRRGVNSGIDTRAIQAALVPQPVR